MRSQGISQFYLHIPRSSANGMNHTCLCLPSRSWYSFTDPGGLEGWVSLELQLTAVLWSLQQDHVSAVIKAQVLWTGTDHTSPIADTDLVLGTLYVCAKYVLRRHFVIHLYPLHDAISPYFLRKLAKNIHHKVRAYTYQYAKPEYIRICMYLFERGCRQKSTLGAGCWRQLKLTFRGPVLLPRYTSIKVDTHSKRYAAKDSTYTYSAVGTK